MATIRTRKRKNGQVSHTATIRIKRNGVIVHDESKTFPTKSAAKSWAAIREQELKTSKTSSYAWRNFTLHEAIERYIKEIEIIKPLGRSKLSHLRQMQGFDIAKFPITEITTQDITGHVHRRRLTGISPATANNDVIWMRVVFQYARTAWGICDLHTDTVNDADIMLKREGFTGKSKRRERRITKDEFMQLWNHFNPDHWKANAIPMRAIMLFAIHTTRRLSEITRVLKSDFDDAEKTLLVRDVKHPIAKIGNHKESWLSDDAIDLIQWLSNRDPLNERIAPFSSDVISKKFTDACKLLGIEDLRFHDLRHEGISRHAERGLQIPELQKYSLHNSWRDLERYTHIAKKPSFKLPKL